MRPCSIANWKNVTTLLALLILATFGGPTVASERLYFLALADVKADKRADYDAFLKQVEPVWNRNGMRLIARFVDRDENGDTAIDDMALIFVESRAGFNRYLADPEYHRIRSLRLDAVDTLTVLESNETPTADIPSVGQSMELSSASGMKSQSCTKGAAFIVSLAASVKNRLIAQISAGDSLCLNTINSRGPLRSETLFHGIRTR